jgi:prolyl 4-hydroxylase
MDLTLLAGRYNALSNDAYHAFRRSAESGEDPWTAAINAARVPDDEWSRWNDPPILLRDHKPRAWRVDTDFIDILEIPSFLSLIECQRLIDVIDSSLSPSLVTHGPDDYRTSSTCYLDSADPDLTTQLDQRFADLLGVPPNFSESLQGARYDKGQYFKEHHDWFDPHHYTWLEHGNLGQRTWTVMVYLNTVEQGGETYFPEIERAFAPIAGTALAWNNLYEDGTPNEDTLHEARPVLAGRKYVITKWFRSRPAA